MPTSRPAGARRLTLLLVLLGLVLAGVLLVRHLPAVGVLAASGSSTLVTFGDSLTEGGEVSHPWPEVLAGRLRAARGKRRIAVVNAGISGNRLLRGGMGASGLDRFERDVLARPGVRWVTVLEGTNDLGFAGSVEPMTPLPTAEELIGAYRRLIERAHAAGLEIYGGTLPPFEGTTTAGYFTPEKEAIRQTVNAWIRTSGAFDAVIDFDRAIRDPGRPSRMLPGYDTGDHLHPNDAGHRAMAEAVDLGLFAGPG
jgi:lysophospholipase L1-like esterase